MHWEKAFKKHWYGPDSVLQINNLYLFQPALSIACEVFTASG